jgi:hypothetical protein
MQSESSARRFSETILPGAFFLRGAHQVDIISISAEVCGIYGAFNMQERVE